MLKKTIIFDDLDGNKVTEEFYFNLSRAEITEMEFSQSGGLSAHLTTVVEAEDAGKLIAVFKDIIVRSIGLRSEDGRRFIKNQEITDNFMQSDAYSVLFMELATQAEAAAAFVNAVIPSGLETELAAKTDVALPADGEVTTFAYYEERLKDLTWTPTTADLQKMDKSQMAIAFLRRAATAL